MNGLSNQAWVLLLAASTASGLVMVLVFRYTSDQKAVRRAKDRLQASLLAVRLFRDQPPVVLSSYLRTLVGIAAYLRATAKPLLVVLLPLLLALAQLDRSLGWAPIHQGEPFLVKAQMTGPNTDTHLELSPGLVLTAPAVHVPRQKQVVWRLVAEREGRYDVKIAAGGQTVSKQIIVSSGQPRVSPVRSRDLWDRFASGEPGLPADGPLDRIEVSYPSRSVVLFGFESNWLVPFFVISLAAGYLFKTVLRIEF